MVLMDKECNLSGQQRSDFSWKGVSILLSCNTLSFKFPFPAQPLKLRREREGAICLVIFMHYGESGAVCVGGSV